VIVLDIDQDTIAFFLHPDILDQEINKPRPTNQATADNSDKDLGLCFGEGAEILARSARYHLAIGLHSMHLHRNSHP
jgi:hypothetical protein